MRAIVTGGTRGIGLSVAQAILAQKGSVMITGLDRARLERRWTTFADRRGRGAGRRRGGRCPRSVRGRSDDRRRRQGVRWRRSLVNNAGVGAFADVATMSDDDWARVIDTNLTGVFYCTRAAIPAMKKSGGGWIINIASLAGRNYFPGGAAYCASKAGLIAFRKR